LEHSKTKSNRVGWHDTLAGVGYRAAAGLGICLVYAIHSSRRTFVAIFRIIMQARWEFRPSMARARLARVPMHAMSLYCWSISRRGPLCWLDCWLNAPAQVELVERLFDCRGEQSGDSSAPMMRVCNSVAVWI